MASEIQALIIRIESHRRDWEELRTEIRMWRTFDVRCELKENVEHLVSSRIHSSVVIMAPGDPSFRGGPAIIR